MNSPVVNSVNKKFKNVNSSKHPRDGASTSYHPLMDNAWSLSKLDQPHYYPIRKSPLLGSGFDKNLTDVLEAFEYQGIPPGWAIQVLPLILGQGGEDNE